MDTLSNLSAEQRRSVIRRDNDRCVMTLGEWAALNGFSVWTAQRLIKAGKGPVITQLSDRRIGITVAANREWQQARERA
jgi:predicted site-specific integrase-resolvase